MDFIYFVIGTDHSSSDKKEVLAVFDTEECANDYLIRLECGCSTWQYYYVERYELNAPKYYYEYKLIRYPLRKKNNEREIINMKLGTPCKEDVGVVKIETNLRTEKMYSTVISSECGISAKQLGRHTILEFLDEYDDENTITYL